MPGIVLSLAISDAILAFSCLFGIFLMAQYRIFEPRFRLPAFGAILCFLLAGSAAAVGTLRYGVSSDWVDVHNMLATASYYMAPALISTAVAISSWNIGLTKAGWGRLILGLMAMFELIRQFQQLHVYFYILNTVALLIMAAAALYRWRQRKSFAVFTMVGTVSYALGGLVVGSEGQLAGYLRLDLSHYLLALGNLFTASGLFQLMRKEAARN